MANKNEWKISFTISRTTVTIGKIKKIKSYTGFNKVPIVPVWGKYKILAYSSIFR